MWKRCFLFQGAVKLKQKILIMMTMAYSGGDIVLRLLGRNLEKRGFDVKIYPYDYPFLRKKRNRIHLLLRRIKWYTADFVKKILMKLHLREDKFRGLLNFKQQIIPFVSDDTIVVYSEGVYGNPLHAKKVVRWFLYHNRFPNNPEAYGKGELVFSFREHFNDYNLNPTCRLFKLNYFDKELYKRSNFGERSGNCYIIRKGKNRPDLPKHFDGPVIDDLPEKEKVAVFNRCKYCYDYDTQTFYSSIAVVCGCIPIIVMEPGKTKTDYMGKGDEDWGLAYGDSPEEIEYAIKTSSQRLQMLDFDKSNNKNVDFFVKEVSEYFSKENTASPKQGGEN